MVYFAQALTHFYTFIIKNSVSFSVTSGGMVWFHLVVTQISGRRRMLEEMKERPR